MSIQRLSARAAFAAMIAIAAAQSGAAQAKAPAQVSSEQKTLPARSTVVSVIASPNLAHNARAIAVRRPGGDQRDVILVDPSVATPADLAAAFAAMNGLRKQFGDTLTKEVRAIPRSAARFKNAGDEKANAARMKRYLAQLGKSKPGATARHGVRRSIEVFLPALSPAGDQR